MTVSVTPATTPEPESEKTSADDIAAAELVLGLLSQSEAEAAQTRLANDSAFAANVRDWQERLAVLAEDLTPVMAPARALLHVREQLGHTAAILSEDPTETTPWYRGPMGIVLLILILLGIGFYWWTSQTP